MRKVVDTNYLRDERLSEFLRASPSNIAVLPDYIAWEAYKKNPVQTLEKSLDILSNYASQVIVLKSMKRIVRQSYRRKGYVKRMVDRQQTLEFGKFCKIMKRTAKGDKSYIKSIIERSETMGNHLTKLEDSLSYGVAKFK